MEDVRYFGVVDYVLFVLLLCVSVGIGVFYAIRGRKSSTSDFLMAKRKVSLVPVSLSLMASFMSAITIIGMPAEMILNGTQYFMFLFGLAGACIVTAFIFVPLFFPMKFISSFEYMEKRYKSKVARWNGAGLLVVSQTVYIGCAALAPSQALEAVTGFPVWATVIVTIGVATLYTFLGGIRAVVWTDAFQSFIMIGGLLAIIMKGTIDVGGIDTVWEINKEWNRINFFDFDPDPSVRHTFWCLVIGGTVLFSGFFASNQASIQRFCALPTERQAKGSLILTIFLVFILFMVVGLAGVVIFAYYAQRGCDPLSAKIISSPNQFLPWFVMEVVGYPGVPGLFLSSIFSGSLSTISSCLSALAAVGLEDFVKPVLKHKNLTDERTTFISKILVVCFGVIGMAVAFLLKNLGGTVLQVSLTFASSATSPILGMFILAAAIPFTNWIGLFVGSIAGLIMPMWIAIGKYFMKLPHKSLPLPNSMCNNTLSLTTFNITTNATYAITTAEPVIELSGIQHLYTLSYIWLPTVGVLSTLAAGVLVSLITKKWTTSVNRFHLFPCLPYGRRKIDQEDEEIINSAHEKMLDTEKNGINPL